MEAQVSGLESGSLDHLSGPFVSGLSSTGYEMGLWPIASIHRQTHTPGSWTRSGLNARGPWQEAVSISPPAESITHCFQLVRTNVFTQYL